ncbi:MAG: hypothetical protein ACRYFW_01930 [Janthinobacterium lividum]
MPSAPFLLALLAVASPIAAAQDQDPSPSRDVVVQGVRSRPSGWREAETTHVVVLSDGSEADLVRMTRNLERLHFLLSGLLGRPDVPDDFVKLRVTLIGDVPEFQAMDLRNRRWQQGPFSDLFTLSRFYDPRADGAVMATTRVDQEMAIERSAATPERVLGVLEAQSLGAGGGAPPPGGGGGTPADAAALQGALIGDFATSGMRGAHDLTVTVGDGTPDIPVTADSLLYAGYAQHYLQTYFPAAYPRWYLDGFGQMFASLMVKGDTVLEYGRSPRGTSAVLSQFGPFPIADVLDDKYLTEKPGKTRWTPVHAWLLTHFLFFSETRRPQLRRYLTARAAGQDAATAAAVFGDQKVLARELRAYFGARKPFEQVRYPADRIEQPSVRRLTQGEAAFVRGRLELGARILLPPEPAPGADPATAAAMTRERDAAVRARDKWLAGLRHDAERWPREVQAQLLLAEAECGSGNADACLAASTRAAALAPNDARPVAWQGTAMVEQAAALPPTERPARIAAARVVIARANRLDQDAIVPLIAYHRSFVVAGVAPSVTAIDALQKAVSEVPNAPATRLSLASALADRGQLDVARQVAMPIAAGAYDSPERPAARALVARAGPAAP